MGHRSEDQRGQAGGPSQWRRSKRDSSALSDLPQSIARQAPDDNPTVETTKVGNDDAQPVRFYVYSDAMAELIFSADHSDSAFAVLRGNFGLDDEGGFLEIAGFSGFTPALQGDELYAAVRRSCDAIILTEAGIARAEDLLLDDRAVLSESGAIVGLFVSERKGNADMAATHAFLHYSLFNVPFQIILAFDPESREMAIYARPPRGRFENMAFRWVSPAHPT